MEDPHREKMFRDLEAIESAGEKLIANQEKNKVFEVNKRQIQEALNRMKDESTPESVWACLSHQFFKLPKHSFENALVADLSTYQKEIENLRSEIKVNLDELRELEGLNPLKGFDLKPLTKDELAGINGFVS